MPVSPRSRLWSCLEWGVVLLLLVGLAPTAGAATIYVDSLFGDDRLDGATPERVTDLSGPVRTLRRAMHLVETGDRVVLANRGTPYEGGVTLAGLRCSGTRFVPLEIVGNGATLSGTRPIEPSAWRRVTGDVWRVTPIRKGWYQLVQEGRAVPEVAVPPGATELPPLEEGTWCPFQGAIYYRPPFGFIPAELPLQLADEQTGITLLDVEYVVIRDLTVQHFRQDGIHLHDRCHEVRLENVVCRENGRGGIVVRGTSHVRLSGVTLAGNRVESLLVEGLATADVEGGEFDRAPTVRPFSPTAGGGN